jgi:hypothetical protein
VHGVALDRGSKQGVGADGGAYPVAAIGFDKVKTCVGWNSVDREQIAKLRHCLNSDVDEVVDALSKQLVQFKGTQELLANTRFVQRLHSLLSEWLMGLLDGTFDEEYVQMRWAFVRDLVEVDLTFEDLLLLEGLARKRLFELAKVRLGDGSGGLLETIYTLDKALCLDRALIFSCYTEIRDAEIERSLLDRFLAITGFSRTLYENLAEAREWSEAIQQARFP